jgi:hypothetical protein
VKFRSEFGLSTDASLVAAAEINPRLSRKYGVALTASEQADIDSRVAIDQQLSPLAKQLASDSGYADLYIDQAAGGIIDVATTGDPGALAPIISRYGPAGARFRTRHVSYSKAFLASLQQKVQSDLLGAPPQGIQVTSVGVDVVNNRLKIGVASPVSQASLYLSDAYGPAVEVVSKPLATPPSCTGQNNCAPPAMGGLEIGLAPALDGAGVCSSAYSARTTSGQVVLVTAGHCAGSPGRLVYNGSYNAFIGQIPVSTEWTDEPWPKGNITADGAYVALDPSMTGSNLVYLSPGVYGQIVGYNGEDATTVGEPVCKVGRTTGLTCGTITSKNNGSPVDGYWVQPETYTSASAAGGDSGATVFTWGSGSYHWILLGVLSYWSDYCTGCFSFSPVDFVDSALGGLTPCTRGCGATYVPLNPARILDSRNGTGLSGPFSSHVARTFQVTGRGGVPANATAVTGNLTVTQQTSAGFLYIGSVAMNDPTSSTLNFPLGDDRANGVTVALGSGGTLSVTYAAPVYGPTAHVLFDVTGYFVSNMSGATYVPLNPARILDSRNGTGLWGPFYQYSAATFQVTDTGVPAAGVAASAIAVTGNLTVTQQTALGYLYLGPVATNYPSSSTLNFPVGDNRANGVTVALGSGGTLSVTYGANPIATTHVIFDVTGYFSP